MVSYHGRLHYRGPEYAAPDYIQLWAYNSRGQLLFDKVIWNPPGLTRNV